MFAGRKLMLAVAELHDRGYGKLRLKAGMSPSGCHWRYRLLVPESSAKGPVGSLTNQKSFDWGDTDDSTADDLADAFTAKFPEITSAAKGADPAYTDWFRMIVNESAPEGLFIEFWDSYDGKCDHVRLLNCKNQDGKYPQPPAPEST